MRRECFVFVPAAWRRAVNEAGQKGFRYGRCRTDGREAAKQAFWNEADESLKPGHDHERTFGFMRNSIGMLVFSVVVVLFALVPLWAQPASPLDVLQSDASHEAKVRACRELAQEGGLDAIPVLAALLDDAALSHMARYALEPMPYPEVDVVLREALDKTSGLLKAGIISSLGIRKDRESLPVLAGLLSDADPAVSQAAAKSLGEMGGLDAVDALKRALLQPGLTPLNRDSYCDALLACAEKLKISESMEERRLAGSVYAMLYQQAEFGAACRAAALRGLILHHADAPWPEDASETLPWLRASLSGEEETFFLSALGVVRELGDREKVSIALSEMLSELPEERKVRLIQVLAETGGAGVGEAVLAELELGTIEVRVAALRALTRLAYTPALETIKSLCISGDQPEELVKTARTALNYFPDEERSDVLRSMLMQTEPEVRRIAIEMIGRGGLDNPIALFKEIADTDGDHEVRVAALGALRERAGIEEVPWLLGHLLNARTPDEMQAAERALQALSMRQRRASSGSIVIQKALYGDLPDGPSADVTGKVRQILESGARAVAATNGNFGDPAPNVVKRLQVDYTENETAFSKTVAEGETLRLAILTTPPALSEAFCAALDEAQGEARLAMLRLAGTTGSPKALAAVCAAAQEEGAVRETALRLLCDWPTPDALPTVMGLLSDGADPGVEASALRGAVQMLGQMTGDTGEILEHYTALMGHARTPDNKKMVLSGLAKLEEPGALDLVFQQFDDEAVKAEALLAAIAIASKLGKNAQEDRDFFNGRDMSGWQGNMKYWRFDDGALTGSSDAPIPRNEFLWSEVEVRDFYLVLDVMLEPDTANAGIQIRSRKVDEHGQAHGYQADMGKDVWGRLYHEHGRGKLDWTDRAEKAVLPEAWNRYEILAVGPAIWTAINGQLGVAFLDLHPEAERSGLVALQVHGGPPQTARYRILKLIHHPKIEMEGFSSSDLINALR
jgi:HEAT repeat protein